MYCCSLPWRFEHNLASMWNEHKMRKWSHSVMSDFLQLYGLYSPWNSPDQKSGVGSPPLLQGIFSTQGSNPGLPHCRQILYQLRHKGSPRILEWVAYPFSSGSSQPRNPTGVSCTASRFFTNWAVTEVPTVCLIVPLKILWQCPSLGLEWKLTFSSPVVTSEFSKFADIFSAAL